MKQVLFYILLVISTTIYAQKTITGTVVDANNHSIPFVTISDGKTQNTFSNENGEYVITTSQDHLYFESIGYTSKNISIGDQTTINIQLVASTTNLNEIVITALGVKREKKKLGYSVQKLDSKDISEVKEINFLDNLSGKVAGVQVTRGAT